MTTADRLATGAMDHFSGERWRSRGTARMLEVGGGNLAGLSTVHPRSILKLRKNRPRITFSSGLLPAFRVSTSEVDVSRGRNGSGAQFKIAAPNPTSHQSRARNLMRAVVLIAVAAVLAL